MLSKILKLSPWFITATVFLYTSQAFAFNNAFVGYNVEIYWAAVIAAAISQTALFFILAYGLGQGVLKRGWQVNYTRKILQLCMFFIPFLFTIPDFLLLDVRMITNKSGGEVTANNIYQLYIFMGVVVLSWSFIFAKAIRSKFPFIATAFAAIDRPEDDGYTLLWLRTETGAVYIILTIVSLFMAVPLFQPLIFQILFLAMIVSSVGDALSGIVGMKYGKRIYQVKALFTNKVYTRTWEGSACIFITAFLAILIFKMTFWHEFSWLIVMPVFLIVPAAATYAESRSPHSWDNPFIVLATLGGLCAAVAMCWGIAAIYFML